jgi:hypothetical protein
LNLRGAALSIVVHIDYSIYKLLAVYRILFTAELGNDRINGAKDGKFLIGRRIECIYPRCGADNGGDVDQIAAVPGE